MLEIRDLQVFYGGIHALRGITLRVPRGSLVTLIGANGAGKSTTLRAVTGLVRPRSGSIRLEGQEIGSWPTHAIVRRGVALVPEGRRVFANLTVQENLVMGAYTQPEPSMAELFERVYRLFPRLSERRHQKAGTLSGGEQQMLAVGRALMSRPRLLCLDEPSLGLAPILAREVMEALASIHREGTTVLLVEQNARMALSMAEYAYVLETGRIVLEGPGPVLLENPQVRRAYLGERASR
ncbi:ABC transporter ATP-binding protein [Carboxydochorda subterranea]|uniref:ABC transporter ATP-binding protein n=2 Tax=Carboxydichorda subterranea TaxID=3109565 RepID=A0ABZ1C225_9FIRM|nr:ABC transporter ATP-binding protein [Limnochorda sp. L945t]WRP18959.1 ABC transporter ATP-binding protein [Limnochorda sp. L945t]